MKIVIETVKHSDQRYDTVGDWQVKDGVWHIKVSELGDWRYEVLIALHEMVELALCIERGVSEASVDAFDMAHLEAEEPGELPDCPYFKEHQFAYAVETLTAQALGIDWTEYERHIEQLE